MLGRRYGVAKQNVLRMQVRTLQDCVEESRSQNARTDMRLELSVLQLRSDDGEDSPRWFLEDSKVPRSPVQMITQQHWGQCGVSEHLTSQSSWDENQMEESASGSLHIYTLYKDGLTDHFQSFLLDSNRRLYHASAQTLPNHPSICSTTSILSRSACCFSCPCQPTQAPDASYTCTLVSRHRSR